MASAPGHRPLLLKDAFHQMAPGSKSLRREREGPHGRGIPARSKDLDPGAPGSNSRTHAGSEPADAGRGEFGEQDAEADGDGETEQTGQQHQGVRRQSKSGGSEVNEQGGGDHGESAEDVGRR